MRKLINSTYITLDGVIDNPMWTFPYFDEEAAAFCVNAVNLDARVIMARAPDSLREKLKARGYSLTEVDLAPFILSGGAAYCMTLRLDRRSVPEAARYAAE